MYGANVRHLAKFYQNRSNGCGDIGDLTVFIMAASAILDFGNSNFLTVRDPFCIIMPNFAKICQSLVVISRFVWFFKMTTTAILFFEKFKILTVWPCRGQSAPPCQISSKSIKRLRRYGDLTVFMLAAVRHLGFWKFKCLNSLRPILHNHANCDIAICAVFQNFNGLSPVGGKCASPCQMLSKSVKRLLRYGDLTVFFSKWRPSVILGYGNSNF